MTARSPVEPTPQSRQGGRLVAMLALCVYLATAGGSLTSVDAVMTYEVTRSLVSKGTTAFDQPGLDNHRGVDGRYYSPFGIGQSLFNIPFYLGARAVDALVGLRVGKPGMLEKAGVALGSTVSAAGVVWLVYLMAFRLSGSLDAARFTALACAFGTLVWPYSKFGFNQPLTGLCLTAGVYAAWLGLRRDRGAWWIGSGTALALAFLTRHEMALAVALVVGWVLVESWRSPAQLVRRATWLGLPVVAAVAFWLWYNLVRFGHPFDTGNLGAHETGGQHFGLSSATLTGMTGLLFSPGRALFLYVPLAGAALIALRSLAARDRSLAVFLGTLFAAFLALYGSLRYWDGLRGYGPRYLVPFLPLMTVPLACWIGGGPRRRRMALLIAGVSVAIQIPGVLVDFSKVSVDHARTAGDYSRDAKIYSLRESALVLNTRAAAVGVPVNLRNLVGGVRPAIATSPERDDDQGFSQRFSFSLDFWWLYLYYLGVLPAPAAAVCGIAPIGLAWLLFSRLPRDARSVRINGART